MLGQVFLPRNARTPLGGVTTAVRTRSIRQAFISGTLPPAKPARWHYPPLSPVVLIVTRAGSVLLFGSADALRALVFVRRLKSYVALRSPMGAADVFSSRASDASVRHTDTLSVTGHCDSPTTRRGSIAISETALASATRLPLAGGRLARQLFVASRRLTRRWELLSGSVR